MFIVHNIIFDFRSDSIFFSSAYPFYHKLNIKVSTLIYNIIL